MLQGRQTPHLLAQHRTDAVEDQFPLLQEPIEIPIEEVGDRLRYDFQGQWIARIAGNEPLPGGRRSAEPLVGEQVLRSLFVHSGETERAHRRAHPFQRPHLLGLLTAGEQHAALVG